MYDMAIIPRQILEKEIVKVAVILHTRPTVRGLDIISQKRLHFNFQKLPVSEEAMLAVFYKIKITHLQRI
jgi:hypothetical protein